MLWILCTYSIYVYIYIHIHTHTHTCTYKHIPKSEMYGVPSDIWMDCFSTVWLTFCETVTGCHLQSITWRYITMSLVSLPHGKSVRFQEEQREHFWPSACQGTQMAVPNPRCRMLKITDSSFSSYLPWTAIFLTIWPKHSPSQIR